MKLTGFAQSDARRAGGPTSVCLVRAADIKSAVYDKMTDSYKELTLAAGVVPAFYEFEEDKAFYRQSVSGKYPLISVQHELSFEIAPVCGATLSAIEELLSSDEGVVAVVTIASGESLLVGQSPELGLEAPLRISEVLADTLSEYGDDSMCRITLTSEDVSMSKRFAGKMP